MYLLLQASAFLQFSIFCAERGELLHSKAIVAAVTTALQVYPPKDDIVPGRTLGGNQFLKWVQVLHRHLVN